MISRLLVWGAAWGLLLASLLSPLTAVSGPAARTAHTRDAAASAGQTPCQTAVEHDGVVQTHPQGGPALLYRKLQAAEAPDVPGGRPVVEGLDAVAGFSCSRAAPARCVPPEGPGLPGRNAPLRL